MQFTVKNPFYNELTNQSQFVYYGNMSQNKGALEEDELGNPIP